MAVVQDFLPSPHKLGSACEPAMRFFFFINGKMSVVMTAPAARISSKSSKMAFATEQFPVSEKNTIFNDH